jgi:hypothetical protein
MSTQADGLWWTVAIIAPAVGAGMFIYGVRQKAALPLATGIALNVLPMLAPTGLGALAITVLIAVAYWGVLSHVN